MRHKNGSRISVPRRILALSPVLAAIIAALLISGCGGSSGGGSSSEEASTTPSSGGPGGFQVSEEAQACLKEKGVELPEPGEGGGPPQGGAPPSDAPLSEGGPPQGFDGGGNTQMKKTFEECGVELPQGKPGGGPQVNSAAFKKQINEYVACVRENGYDLPEPNLSGEGPVFQESEVNQEDPKFKKASEACQSKLSAPGSGG